VLPGPPLFLFSVIEYDYIHARTLPVAAALPADFPHTSSGTPRLYARYC
jgi:hypothetical protein